MKTIVALGAGLAAMPLIRQTMRNVVLPSDSYKLVVVAPNTHMLFPLAMPRVLVPGAMSEDKVLLPVSSQFSEYPSDKFQFLQGTAESLTPESNQLSVKSVDGNMTELSYDYLIIATGSSSRDNTPWKTLGTTEKTKERLFEIRNEVEQAKTIVIAGGGATGTETAGEFGFEYAQSGKKAVYFVYNDELPLVADMIPKVRRQAKLELERQKVKLIPNSKVTKVTTASGKETVLEITDKSGKTNELKAGAYISATGVIPNASFAPASMLDAGGFIKQTTTLQAEGHDNIFVAGDVGSLEISKAMVAAAQTDHLVKYLPGHILGGEAIATYTPDTKNVYAITLGRSKATGQMNGWKLPGFIVSRVKRNFFSEQAPDMAKGKKTSSTTFEK
ncbi:uncharacterized protein F5Z01DRAFT_44124 [Emericellopsis atlantica]|uniref:FAD/NAD(P)-binding domain-containing protein n=1 Tax=Emericellopsis atlantica TaxID=2614577 RepID=A0A9P7ZN94_9HYPO|nr:uncharacterized protein F5Z01DRAFT_44124 [Emericellopsis atlantica]KAG9255249.1 hypothetical protein F5Z01DRAFT_44124 [Emericellopsis atlantica]